ncbi:MAG: tripartite tricarboxylate transporter substrate binding protein [Gammaproteobacteria bacterium]|nr:tripartite tricarboxylate transporter substrate binding protein [Gammaproteobacteria bacterium]
MRMLSVVFGALCALFIAAQAHAEYPEKPITIIVAFAPGGGTDVGARMAVPFLERYMPKGTRFVVVNKPGAGGEIGATAIATAAPDGYTIGFMNLPNIMMKPHERKTHYTVDSFEPIANMVYDVATIATLPNSKYKTLQDVVDEARKRPGEITVSSAGTGSNTHLDVIAFQNAAGIKLNHVPFDGGAQSRNALLGGHTELFATALGDSARFHDAGEMRVLGIMGPTRSQLLPDVPTYKELGYDVRGGSARGLVGPKGMPKAAVEMIASAVEKAVNDPEMIQRAKEMGLPLSFAGTAEYAQMLQDYNTSIARIWAETPWK